MLVGLKASNHPASSVPRIDVCVGRGGCRIAEADVQNPVTGVERGVASGQRRGVADDKVAAPAGRSVLLLL
jgi:hypothetical protein